jgi:tRNA-Thr(GGU) m(6)t(6)A37 methyltransferase TsaA
LKICPSSLFGADGITGHIELFDKYVEGLKEIEGFSHIILLYKLHKVADYELSVTPFMDKTSKGVFATRAPKRPNAIGISTVELLKVDRNILLISGVDMLNESPLLDIKPFYEKFDNRFNTRQGWLCEKEMKEIQEMKSDERFK